MADNENIGGISVQIVGNYAPLLKDLEAATGIAQKAGSDIAAGLNKGAAATGEFEAKIAALVASGNTLGEALSKVQTGATQMASGVGAAGAAAQAAATQLKLFDDAAMVPYANAAGQLHMFADELDPIGNEAKQAAAGVEQFAAAEQHAGDEAVQSASRLDRFKTSVGDLSGKIQAGAGGLITLGGMLTAAVTLPIIGVATAAIKLSGDLEHARVAFTTMLGSADAAKQHLEELKKFAAATPFEFPDLVQASKRLQALGFTAKEIIPTLTAVGNAAAGLSSGVEGINRITLALGQMRMAGVVNAQDMKQLTEAGIDGWKILAQTLKTDVAGAMELVHKRAVDSATAVPALLAGMNAKFHNLMEDQSKTLLGMWSNFKDQLSFTLMDIGNTLAPMAKTILADGLMPILDWARSAAAAFAGLPPILQGAITGFAGLAAAAGPLLVALGGMGFAITQISTALPILSAVAGGLATVVGVTLVAALAAAVIGFNDLHERMATTQKMYDEEDKKFQAYIKKLLDGAKTADQMAAAEDKVREALDAGALSKMQATEILGKLADAQKKLVGLDWSKQASEMGISFHILASSTSEAMTTTEAFAVKLKGLRDGLQTAREALDMATAKYKDHKATADDVGRAYDAWEAATKTLAGAQSSLLPVVTNVHKATKEFVDLTKRDFPDAEKEAANATEALNIKVELQATHLMNAKRWLDEVLERWNKFHNNAGEVAKALDGVNKAQAAVNKSIGEVPDLAAVMKPWQAQIDAAVEAFRRIPPAIQAIPPLVRTLEIDLHDLGITLDKTGDVVSNKLIAAFKDLAQQQGATLEMIEQGWGKVSAAVNKLARTDLPAAIKAWDAYYDGLRRVAGTQGELLAVEQSRLELHIKMAERVGADATEQILALHRVKLQEQALIDQSRLMGDLLVSIDNDIIKGWGDAGKAIADAIVDGKNFEKAMREVGKNVVKMIMEDLVGTAFKAMKDALIGVQGGVFSITKAFDTLAKTVSKDIGGYADDAAGPITKAIGGGGGSGASGGILGQLASFSTILGAISNLINGIIQNFQLAHLNKTMGRVEENTRFLEIKFAKFAEADEWQRHNEILDKLGMAYTRFGDIWVEMVHLREAFQMEDYAGQFEWLWDQQSGMLVAQFNAYTNQWDKANEFLKRIADAIAGTEASTNDIHWLWTNMSAMSVAQFNANQLLMRSTDDRLATSNGYLKNIDTTLTASRALLASMALTLAGVPKFASGSTYVPEDMFAMVHQGEAIIPADDNPFKYAFSPDYFTSSRFMETGGSLGLVARSPLSPITQPQVPDRAQMAIGLPQLPESSSASTAPVSITRDIGTGYGLTQNVEITVYESSNPRETARQIVAELKTLKGGLGAN